MIAITDYGAGNLQSVYKAFKYINADVVITSDADVISSADGVVLPGVGSFGDAMDSMLKSGLADSVKGSALSGKPFLGICLGLQLLFDSSEESPEAKGFGILEGSITKIPANGLKVPHMGWNSLDYIADGCPLFNGVNPGEYVYFVHSYYLNAAVENEVAAKTHYGVEIDAAVWRNNLFAVQFHPEKSGNTGLKMLRNFASLCGGRC
ncbi:MAG: imidazole glycerol phosphate synthase subunit HisH [Clostridiales bacterium]|nr:imidazole glycerol phosphate synthase subunit HisH [Clostridiales bacterium]